MTLIDGQPATLVDVADRGLAYGDGLFETMRIEQGRILRLELHLARLSHGCERLQLQLSMPVLRRELADFASRRQSGVVKLIVTRGSGQRGYACQPAQPARRILQHTPLPDWPAENFSRGVRLFACTTRLARQPLLAGLKHLNRLEQVMARAEWQSDDYAEGLMLDSEGLVTDGVFSNLFFVRQGVLYTPLLDQAGVAGVMRDSIMRLAGELDIEIQEGRFRLDDLQDMNEVFCCNSLYGIWPVREYARLSWPPGAMTLRLQQKIAQER